MEAEARGETFKQMVFAADPERFKHIFGEKKEEEQSPDPQEIGPPGFTMPPEYAEMITRMQQEGHPA